MIKQIYLDMDGVLVDLTGGLKQAGLWVENYDADKFWAQMAQYGTDFWANLPLYPWSGDLVRACREAVGIDNVYILAAPSRTCPPVCTGKMLWLQRYFPDFVNDGRFIIANQKHLLAQPDRMLIDDKLSNCEPWGQRGTAILFPPKGLVDCPKIAPEGEVWLGGDPQFVIDAIPYIRDGKAPPMADFLKRVDQLDSPPAAFQSSKGLLYPKG